MLSDARGVSAWTEVKSMGRVADLPELWDGRDDRSDEDLKSWHTRERPQGPQGTQRAEGGEGGAVLVVTQSDGRRVVRVGDDVDCVLVGHGEVEKRGEDDERVEVVPRRPEVVSRAEIVPLDDHLGDKKPDLGGERGRHLEKRCCRRRGAR